MSDFRTIVMPYCLKKMEDGSYIVLNRKYKPVGFNTHEHLKYENYPTCHKIRGINKRTAASLSHNNNDDTNMIFLYDDGCIPTQNAENMHRYLDKLAVLAKYKISE